MNRIIALLDRALASIERLGVAVAAVAFAAMMIVTVVDVVGRYALNSPLTWSFDLITAYLLVAGFFLAISATQANRQHINIDLIARSLPPRLRAALLAPAFATAVVFVLVIAWAGTAGFLDAWNKNLVMDGVIPWPRWPTYLLVALGAGLLALRLTIDCLALVVTAAGGATNRDPFAHEHLGDAE